MGLAGNRMRLESTFFYPCQEGEHKNSTVFDSERGIIKVGGTSELSRT